MAYKILAINPGSTSTKVAVYTDEHQDFTINIQHPPEDLARFESISDQYEWRKELIVNAIKGKGVSLDEFDTVIGRGGLINPIESGVYEVNDDLRRDLINAKMKHASNLGGLIARDLADEIGVKSYIADPVVVDEMMPYARISGLPELPRESIFHALNQKAMARLFAKESGKAYEDLNLIVCHMGGGCSVSAHRRGRVIDTNNAFNGGGPFTPERAGSLPSGALIELCFSGKYTKEELLKKVSGEGGLIAHLGTNSVTEALDRILNRDLHAMLILRAMCYNIAKEIGQMSIALKGDVDAIILTGGIAHSKRVTDFIAEHVDFIAPIYVYPGENELRSLAENALAVLRGERVARVYVSEEYDDPSQVNDLARPSKIRNWLLEAIAPAANNLSLSAIRHYIKKLSLPKH